MSGVRPISPAAKKDVKIYNVAQLSKDWEPDEWERSFMRKRDPNAAPKKDEKIYNVVQLLYPDWEIDWESIYMCKKAPNAAAKKDEKAVNAARRAGADIEIVKKYNAGTNKAASSSTSLNTKKLDDESENLAHDRVPTELKKCIMQARMDKKLSQAQLAQLINEKPRIVQEYESGKAIPNQQIITKLERALGVKLRGKK